MEPLAKALKTTKAEPAQTAHDLARGVAIRRTAGGIPVLRIHYSADPARDPEINPEWKRVERKTYTSEAGWQREQEIVDEAGGGELVFADTLVTYWDKIIISDPKWRPDPRWRVEGAFDHGRTNPTALERSYHDFDGNIIFAGEYYQPGMEIFEHAPNIRQMADINKLRACYADPTIFDVTVQQSQRPGRPAERAKSINMLYVEQGIEIFSPFMGDRSDVSFAARVMLHWANLDVREPSLKIVCPNYSERPQYGLHNWSCPNLVWEMMRRRRVKLTATQLMNQNPSEALVDRENHGSDCAKYELMSWPEPTIKTPQEIAAELVRPLAEQRDLTSALINYQHMVERLDGAGRPSLPPRLAAMRRRR